MLQVGVDVPGSARWLPLPQRLPRPEDGAAGLRQGSAVDAGSHLVQDAILATQVHKTFGKRHPEGPSENKYKNGRLPVSVHRWLLETFVWVNSYSISLPNFWLLKRNWLRGKNFQNIRSVL